MESEVSQSEYYELDPVSPPRCVDDFPVHTDEGYQATHRELAGSGWSSAAVSGNNHCSHLGNCCEKMREHLEASESL